MVEHLVNQQQLTNLKDKDQCLCILVQYFLVLIAKGLTPGSYFQECSQLPGNTKLKSFKKTFQGSDIY